MGKYFEKTVCVKKNHIDAKETPIKAPIIT
uniref:Uncharacterized protein n=1 Tax=Lepeophtheirus salmonis TaxID=72036 RepID=A0A0K2TN56_LEPSM